MLTSILFWALALTGALCWGCLIVMIWFIWLTERGNAHD